MYTLKVHSPIRIGFYPKNILRQQKTLINKHKGDVRVYIYIYTYTYNVYIYICKALKLYSCAINSIQIETQIVAHVFVEQGSKILL